MERTIVNILPCKRGRLVVFSHEDTGQTLYSLAWLTAGQQDNKPFRGRIENSSDYEWITESVPDWILLKEIARILNPSARDAPNFLVREIPQHVRKLEWFLLGRASWLLLGYTTERVQQEDCDTNRRFCIYTDGGNRSCQNLDMIDVIMKLREELERHLGERCHLSTNVESCWMAAQFGSNRPVIAEA